MKSLFGKDLFKKKNKPAVESLYDFAQHGVLNNPEFSSFNANNYVSWGTVSTGSASVAVVPQTTPIQDDASLKTKGKKDKEKKNITPKELHELKTLNQVDMAINCNEDYITENVAVLKDKLTFIDGDSGASKYGKKELTSLIERLENRRNFGKYQNEINEFPHTTNEAISQVLDKEKHLKCKEASSFIPDFPKDAVDAMKKYEKMCLELCGKKPVFYVIADKKDFEPVNGKRDPILLAQSPFGFFWQILGAWDEEMVFLGDL